MPIIETKQLTKQFGPTIALKEVSFSVEAGSLVAIAGPNGSGKSTLLKILAGLVLPTRGEAVIGGEQAGSRRLPVAIGYAAGERPGFYERLTGWQNLEFFAALYGLHGRFARNRIEALLGYFDACADKPYQECSSGMKQQLLIVRALLHDPKVLLLDEPTRSLDGAHRADFYRKLGEDLCRRQGKTVLLVTHQLEEVDPHADWVIQLEKGMIRSFSEKNILCV